MNDEKGLREQPVTHWMPGKAPVSAVQFAGLVGGSALTEYGPVPRRTLVHQTQISPTLVGCRGHDSGL